MSQARNYRRMIQKELGEYEKILKRIALMKARPEPDLKRIARIEDQARRKVADLEKFAPAK